MSRRQVFACFAVIALALAWPSPAAGQPSGDTTVTFTVQAADLTITVPQSASLGGGAPGGSLSGQLGTVQVTDQRAALLATWVASVTTTEFTTGTGSPDETIGTGSISYWSGPATATTGVGVPVPGQLTSANAVTLDQARTAFSKLIGAGNNSTSWDPTLVVAIPQTAVAGLYTGTVTHSVA